MALLSGRAALAPKHPVRSEGAIPELQSQPPMPSFLSQVWRRNGEHRAPGMGQAVAAHLPGAGHPGKRATSTSTYDQQVIGFGGYLQQDPARLAALHDRLDRRAVRYLPPDCDQSAPEPQAGRFLPFVPQVAGWLKAVGAVTAWRQPRQHGHQDGALGAGHVLRITQRAQAAR